MVLHIFRTDIKTKKKIKSLRSVLDNHSHISQWNIDRDDIDNVLRVEGNVDLTENDIVALVNSHGFFIEALPD